MGEVKAFKQATIGLLDLANVKLAEQADDIAQLEQGSERIAYQTEKAMKETKEAAKYNGKKKLGIFKLGSTVVGFLFGSIAGVGGGVAGAAGGGIASNHLGNKLGKKHEKNIEKVANS